MIEKSIEKASKNLPKWTPRRAQEGLKTRGPLGPGGSSPPRSPKTPQDRPKTAPRRPKTPQDRPKISPRPSKTPPGRPQGLPKTCPRRLKIPQDPQKTAQDRPRGAQDRPTAPQESPRGVQRRPREAPKRASGTGGAFEAVPPFKAGQTPPLPTKVRLASFGL